MAFYRFYVRYYHEPATSTDILDLDMEVGAWVGRPHQYDLYTTRPGLYANCRRARNHMYANADYCSSLLCTNINN